MQDRVKISAALKLFRIVTSALRSDRDAGPRVGLRAWLVSGAVRVRNASFRWRRRQKNAEAQIGLLDGGWPQALPSGLSQAV